MVYSSVASAAAVILVTSADATRFEECCATLGSEGECSFVEKPDAGTQSGCFPFWWMGNDLLDREYVLDMHFTTDYSGTVNTTEGRQLEFQAPIPDEWLQAGWQLSGKSLEARLGRHVVGLTLNPEVTVVSEPIPNNVEMTCATGAYITCPLDPVFSYVTYTVTGTNTPKCTSPGSWSKLRRSFTVKFDDCPSLNNGNANVLEKLLILEPDKGNFRPVNAGDLHDIPNQVECMCIFNTSATETVVLSDDGRWAEVLKYASQGKHMNFTAMKKNISQDQVQIILNASTELDRIQIQECSVDSIDYGGRRMKFNLPLVRKARTADSFPQAELRLSGPDYGVLQNISLKIEDGFRHQLVSLNEITFGRRSLRFECEIQVCLDLDPSRCEVRRLEAKFLDDTSRRLDDEDPLKDNRAVGLLDSDCSGLRFPDMTSCDEAPTSTSVAISSTTLAPDAPWLVVEFKFDALDYNKLTPLVMESLERTMKENFARKMGVDQESVSVKLSAGSVKVQVSITGTEHDVSIPSAEELTQAVKNVPDIGAVIADGYSIDDVVASEPQSVQGRFRVRNGTNGPVAVTPEPPVNMAVSSHVAPMTAIVFILSSMMM